MDPKKDEPSYEVVEDSSYEILDEKGEPASAGAPTIAVDRGALEDGAEPSPKEAPPPLTPAPTLPDAARPKPAGPKEKAEEARSLRDKISIEKKGPEAEPKPAPRRKIEVEVKEKTEDAGELRDKIKISEPRRKT